MGPRLFSLASLALLLLALCRFSSAGPNIDIPSQIVVKPPHDVEYKKMMATMPGVFGAIVKVVDTTQTIDPTKKKVIDNEVLCALDNANLAKQFETAQYGSGARDATAENKFANDHLGVVCATAATTPEYKCFCEGSKNVAVYCALEKYKATITDNTKYCAKEALETIKASSTVLAEFLDFAAMATNTAKAAEFAAFTKLTDPAKLSKDENSDMAKLYCAAIDSNVISVVDKLFASDALHVEDASSTKSGPEITAKCNDPAVKDATLWKCVCTGGKGGFCAFHAVGKFFEEEGYLSCNCPEKKFVVAKRPAAFLPERLPQSAAAPIDCGTTVPSGGGTTVAPKPATSAATSILPLAPAATAAALLLMRH